jgi:cytosine/adenosine deaminase-related metal-dependent hydrolase
MVRKGLLANIGAHGEQPLGLNYHAEMDFFATGGLTNYEVSLDLQYIYLSVVYTSLQILLAATASGAKTLGLFSSLGSLSPGKLADFLIFPPEVDLLSGQISNKTLQILFVARGGRIWEASTMVEFWPVSGRKQVMPILNAD